MADEDGGAHARDGALHAFYALPDGSFGALRDRLSAASPISSRGPLSVHPRLLTEGLHGPFADELSAIFATFATGPRLFRVTHFRRLAPSADGPAYAFRLRDRRGETFFDENVPATWAPEQTAFPLASAPRIAPSITAEDDVTAVFRAASDARAAAFGATARVLDPAVHSSESTDCASCHLAGSIARQASRRYGLDAGDAAGVSTSGSPVWPTAAETADDDLHLLSYRGRTLTIAARTRHEIAASLAFINRVDE